MNDSNKDAIIASLKRKIKRLEEENKKLKEQVKINYADIYKYIFYDHCSDQKKRCATIPSQHSVPHLFPSTQKNHPAHARWLTILAMTYLPSKRTASIVGAEGLNFCVRDGYRCVTFAIVTRIFIFSKKSSDLSKLHSNFLFF